MNINFGCRLCGGPHEFDTTVPSPLWNRVIRGKGLPDTLCLSCIVRAFVRAGEGFTAELNFGDGDFHGVPIEVSIGGKIASAVAPLEEQNTALRSALVSIGEVAANAMKSATEAKEAPCEPS